MVGHYAEIVKNYKSQSSAEASADDWLL